MQVYISDIFLLSTLKGRENYILVNFAGSDFKYPYVRNKEVFDFSKKFQYNIKDVKEMMRGYIGVAGGVIFSGAEPCLQRQALQHLAKWCKGHNLKVVLKTNGGSPLVLHALIKAQLVDKVRMEFMAPLRKGIFKKVTNAHTFFKPSKEVMNNFKKSLDIIKGSDESIGVVFRTIIVPGLLYRKEDILDIAKSIHKVDGVWVLEQFRNENVNGVFKHIRKPSRQFLKNLKESCLRKYPNLRIQLAA